MLLRENIRIENARLYPSVIVDQLRIALSNGAELHADESRRDFHKLCTGLRTYFIYVSPASGNITLIATWAQKHAFAKLSGNGRVRDLICALAARLMHVATHYLTVKKMRSFFFPAESAYSKKAL
jgi:predicted ATPase